ncbi:hypothetical protein DRN76_04600 [Methanosarcinales archaeon]|nr:MAG: hypothetical protein DRN76_04600 [Methanosarcinales archaeon]
MTRQQIKRLLALLKAEAEYKKDFSLKLPEGFKESFESQSAFRGWINYHETWDVDKEDVWLVISRKVSLVAEWHKELMKVVPVILPDGQIMEADEWQQKSHSIQ